jgi:hypothetical protein
MTSLKTAIDYINEDLLGCLPAHGGERAKKLVKGDRIHSTAAAAVLAISGRLAHVRELPMPRERRLIIDFYGENSPLLFVDDDSRYAEVIDRKAEVMIWTEEQLASVYEKRPKFLQYVNDWLTHKQSDLIERLAEFAACGAEDRLWLALLRLGRQFGTRTPGGIEMPPFTHQNLADYLGTSREMASHLMRRSASNGLISYDRKGIRLRRLVNGMTAGS